MHKRSETKLFYKGYDAGQLMIEFFFYAGFPKRKRNCIVPLEYRKLQIFTEIKGILLIQRKAVELTAETVDNWQSYKNVLIGYPIWWEGAAWPVDIFVKANDFTGKTVIPFATFSSSGMGESGEL